MKSRLPIRSSSTILLIFWVLFALVSCKNESSLADGGWLQKRRYQKGYHLNVKSSPRPENRERSTQKAVAPPLVASLGSDIELEDYTSERELIEAKESNVPEIAEIKTESVNSEIPKDDKVADNTRVHKKTKSGRDDPDNYTDERKLNTLALLSFMFSILSFFILGIPFGVAALVCGIIGLSQCEKEPEKYSGKGFAIAGIIVGLVAIILVLAALATASP